MGPAARLLRSLGRRRWFAAILAPVAAPLDRLAYRLTKGRRMVTPQEVPTLMLTTTGRRSGRLRQVPLLYVRSKTGFVVVGTNWGRRPTPEWALNLGADPRAMVEVSGDSRAVSARLVPEAHHDQWWPDFDAIWPGYAGYRCRAAHRPIRMFELRVE